LILKWLITCETKFTILQVLWISEFLVLRQADNVTLEVSNDFIVFDPCSVVVSNFVVHIDATRNENVIFRKVINNGLNDVTVNIATITVLNHLHCQTRHCRESKIQDWLHCEDVCILKRIYDEATSLDAPVV